LVPPSRVGAGDAAGAASPFRTVAPRTVEASLAASEPDTPLEGLRRIVFGQPIPERLAAKQQLNKVRALAVLSSDALSSVAYGTEASLTVLVAAGAAALTSNLVIGLVIAALMLVVGASYRQTIHAYPSGGGSYLVARANLGTLAGLVAAAALLLDYLLTVSVSVAAGVDAIASALPVLVPARLPLDLAAILFITLINLRGLRSSGTIFALPTYLFLGSFGLTLVLGVARALLQGGLTAALPPAASSFPPVAQPLTLLLILTAFASGCSAMTGVEAISNGVPAFEGETPQTRAQHAAQTLVVMITLLVALFLGTTYLAWRVGAAPTPTGEPTVTAQIARFAATGPIGWLYYVVQTATLLILVFAANTSFADFPRLAALLAHDEFAPAMFAYRGERLAFSTGIVVLGGLSALVLWIFGGSVTGLINLYALGVFTAFTLSQTGMVVHWLNRRGTDPTWRRSIVFNAAGAIATGVVTAVIAIAKFDRGAWVIVVLVPALVITFLSIRHYYERPRTLVLPSTPPVTADLVLMPILTRLDASDDPSVPASTRVRSSRAQARRRRAERQAEDRRRIVRQELAFAAKVAPEVVLVQVVTDRAAAETFHRAAERLRASVAPTEDAVAFRDEAVISPYRTIVLPLAHFIQWQAQTTSKDTRVAVLLPCELHSAWWAWPLRRRVADHVRAELERDQAAVAIVDLPYTLAS
jgi:amino acid transporter